ncbi:Eukaryotic translation initiation factor 3 subunit 10, related, partial [Eimeria tenella]
MLDEIKRIGGRDSKITIKGKQLTDINIQDVLDGHVDYDDLEKAQRLQLHN